MSRPMTCARSCSPPRCSIGSTRRWRGRCRGFGDAEQMLRVAQHRGLFLVALDERGEWYRYHALFAEAVQAEARSRAPELVQQANEQAATWFEACGDLVMAVDHWLAAGVPTRRCASRSPPRSSCSTPGRCSSIERIAGLIPASVVGADPHRQLDYAMLHHVVDGEVSRWWVNEAEATIAATRSPGRAADTAGDERARGVRPAVRRVGRRRAIRASAAIDPRGIGEGDTEVARRSGLQLMRAKAWMELPEDAEQVFRVFARHHRISPVVRDFYAPCIWALAAAIGGRIREAELWCARATATANVLAVPPAPYHGAVVRSRGDPSRARRQRRGASHGSTSCVWSTCSTYHSLRTLAEVELAMCFDQRRPSRRCRPGARGHRSTTPRHRHSGHASTTRSTEHGPSCTSAPGTSSTASAECSADARRILARRHARQGAPGRRRRRASRRRCSPRCRRHHPASRSHSASSGRSRWQTMTGRRSQASSPTR